MGPNWKLERIKALDDEVKDLHPVLHELFRRIPNISAVTYTQGNRENGADFVITRADNILLDEDYIGVIVKSGQIKQNHDDVNRQIRECELPRPIASGLKEIVISEIWVVTSKNVSRSAQDHINHEYRSKKIKFFDAERLVVLIDKYYPEYWEFANFKLNKYVVRQLELIERWEGQNSLLPSGAKILDFQCQVAKRDSSSRRKFQEKKGKPCSLLGEVSKNRFLFLEGGMGSGKSELIRSTAKQLCQKENIEQYGLVPYLTNYRDLSGLGEGYKSLIKDLESELDDDKKEIVIFVDGFDETSEEADKKADFICSVASFILARGNMRLVVASRPINEEKILDKIDKCFDCYWVCPLSYGAIIGIVEKLCNGVAVSNKFKSDLQGSHLMQALPKTPMSAILLGRLLAENVKELPSTLPELYSKYTDLVLGRWDIQKGSGSEKEYETIQRITASVAAYMLENDLEFLGVGELENIFKEYLGMRRTGQDAGELLNAFLERNEIIGFSDARGAVFFKHKTFKEFFYATLQIQRKGVEAPLIKPFDLYWQGAEYFYLGLVKDAPQRIESLSAMVPADEMELLIKVSSMGEFLLAAYQTPYAQVSSAVGHIFKDLATLYSEITYQGKESWLRRLPELQLLCLFTMAVRSSYGYDFFTPALHEAKIHAELDVNLNSGQRNVLIFLVDSVLASLGDEGAFVKLSDEYDDSLDWVLRVGISNAAADVDFANSATKKMSKKILKTMKGNAGFRSYLQDLQQKPIDERKNMIH